MPAPTAMPPKPISERDLAWEDWSEVPRFGRRVRALSRAALGEDRRVGVAVEELAPGMQSAPAHYHVLEEEHVYILEGRLTLRLDEERHEMTAGDYVCFPAGLPVGHAFLNSGAGPCRYLMIGERNPAEVCVYPDSNKVSVRALRRQADIFDMAAMRGYWDGEETG